jgi:hypothetical protein
VSYAEAAAKGPKQTPEEAAAPPVPEIVPVETASTSSLVDVDLPSVRTVPSDFREQEIQTETQAARIEREQEAAAAAEEAAAAVRSKKGKAKAKAGEADSWMLAKFSRLSDDGAKGLAITNMVGFLGVSAFLGYKAWGLYEKGRLGWKEVGIGMGIMTAVGLGEALFGGYLIRAKGTKKN